MGAVVAMSLASRASASLLAAAASASLTSPSPSSSAHMLFYHGSTVTASEENPDGESGECKLFGSFSLIIQAALGALALLSLVYKRWRERPQRPLKVWAFDVSKQVFGSAMLHMANLLMSMFSAGQLEIRKEYKPNPCSFYLLNLGIDVSLLASYSHPSVDVNLRTNLPDHPWHSDPDSHPPCLELLCFLHPSCQPTRVHRVRKLWSSTQGNMVAEAVPHLFCWAARHEGLCFLPHPAYALHRPNRRLGIAMDGRKHRRSNHIRDAPFPRDHERHPVLYHRCLH